MEETRQLRGNEWIVIDDPRVAWIVETGSVGLFSVTLERGEPAGPRRFLFSCGPGDTLLGIERPDGAERAVVAVALEDSRVVRRAESDAVADADAVERWVAAWNGCLGELSAPGPESATDGLAAFHRALFERVQRIEEDAEREERTLLHERDRRSREVTEEAVAQLTSVLRPPEGPQRHGSALFVAAAAVAEVQGIQLHPPAVWEESGGLTDPMERLCRTSHVRCRKVQLHDGWWRQDCGPLLATRRDGQQPVALLPASPRRYRAFDPQTREAVDVDPEVAAALEPEAWALYRRLPEESASALELIKFALHGRSADLWAILATATGATLLGMFTPQATAMLVDHAIPNAEPGLLLQIGLGLLAAACGGAVFRFAQGIAMIRLETAADAVTQAAVWDRLLNLQMSFFRRFSTGDLQSRVSAIGQIRAYLSGTTLRTLFSSVVLLLNLALLVYYSRTLALVALGVAAVSAAVTVLSGSLILRCTRLILELKGRFFGLMVQLINGVPKLRVAAAEERAFARWAGDYAELLRLELRQRRIQDNVQVANIAIATLSAIILFSVAATLIGSGDSDLTTGVFLAFHVAYGTFIGAIVSLSNTVTDVMAVAILRERARPILEEAPEINERKADPGQLDGLIELRDVSFRYQPEGRAVLDNVSLRADAGQFVAMVGPSGSGKSTLLRLLLGLESPGSGAVYFDGQDLSGLDVYAVRRQLGVVLQNGRINAGSLFENVACGTRISLNDAWDAARSTGFADDIEAMPMGMHTVISEGGTNLSGGQRQRLLLTRALVHRPRIVLLDEATSALDNRTQAVVSESLQMLNVTRIVIAHRLSTIRTADRIYVVDAGRVVQHGSFDELAGQDGLFARLIARQVA